MLNNVPRISDRLRERTTTLAADLSPVVERAYETLATLDGHQSLAPAATRDVFESIAMSATVWFRTLLDGAPPSLQDVGAFQEIGRRRVHQRVPLQSTLQALRVGMREIWRTYIGLGEDDRAIADELLYSVSPYLFDYFDVVAQTIVQTYLAEQYQQARWRESLLHQLYSIVFHSPGDVDGFHATAEALGLDFAVPRIALAIDVDLGEHAPAERGEACERIALAAARHLDTVPDSLVRAWHRGRLILWTPCVHGDSICRSDRLTTERARTLAAALPQIRRIGIGLMNDGPAGWAASVEEAMKALDAATNDGRDRVRPYASISIEEGARRADNVRRYLVSLLEQLSPDPELLVTLETYFEHGQRLGKTAGALAIHANTLSYRIERIEALLGASFDDVSWVARLDVALKLRRAGRSLIADG
ncbi:PucR family transcriptional regulator [Burkholderia metallica]|uniref:PucR family transcriptional regulator n=1 Tax=Burkholderia metallica TaxID=488729 RepID=UPI0034A02F51